MGQSFDSDRPKRDLPPVAPPPRKLSSQGPTAQGVSNGASQGSSPDLPEMAVFRGLGSGSSAPPGQSNGSFGPLPKVHAPPTRTGTFPPFSALPAVTPPPSRRPPLPPPSRRDPLADSITKLQGAPLPADTYRDQPYSSQPYPPSVPSGRGYHEDSITHPKPDEVLDWEEEEESTHVFHSSAPPPMHDQGANGRMVSARGVGEPPPPAAGRFPSPLETANLSAPPTTSTVRLATVGQEAPSQPPPAQLQTPQAQARNLVQATPLQPLATAQSASPMFPPPPPIPSITQARPMEQSVPGINPGSVSQRIPGAQVGVSSAPPGFAKPEEEVVRDQPYVRLPQGNPHSATELGIKKPTLPSTFAPHAAAAPAHDRDPKKWLLGAAGAAALLSIIGLVTFLFTRRPGGIQVEVNDATGASVPKADVFVDGRKVCDTTPCVVNNLDVGRHTVRVMTPSEEKIEPLTVDVAGGSIAPLTFTLKPSLGVLVAGGDQAGVTLFVDGKSRGALPAKLTDLTPGKHELKLSGDRYKTVERSIDIKAGETIDIGAQKLEVVKGRVTLAVKTEGVTVTLVPNNDEKRGKLLEPPYTRPIEIETSSGTWKLVAKKKGAPDFVQAIDFSDGVAEKIITVDLNEKAKEPEAIALTDIPSTPTTPERPPPGPATPTTPGPTTPKPEKTSEPAPETAGNGTLNINSIPASRVLLDGQPMGETPRMGISVSAGTHTVTFIHPELGKKSVTVKVGAGETKTASAKLRTD